MHGVDAPMYYVAFMTFILIFSSVTMVLAVDAGHQMKKGKVILYLALTIIGGMIFVGSQAWEWKNFIQGEYGAVTTRGGNILQFVNTEGERVALSDIAVFQTSEREQHTKNKGVWYDEEANLPTYSVEQIKTGFLANTSLLIRTQSLNEDGEKTILTREESLQKLDSEAIGIVEGANLTHNEYGVPLFADFFFFITGFHGFHVISGVLINIIIFFNVVLGTYERRGSYEMVEKVGLYWHFVDLVWVFIFTFFYLV